MSFVKKSNFQTLVFALVFLTMNGHTNGKWRYIRLLKLHTLQLSLKQINKILGQIDGYLFFWPFCSEKKIM